MGHLISISSAGAQLPVLQPQLLGGAAGDPTAGSRKEICLLHPAG
jgi:hypothetical protein